METEIRRCQQTLYYSGKAFIIFGVWSFIKIFSILYLNPTIWTDLFEAVDVDVSEYQYFLDLVFGIIMAAVVIIDIWSRLYIGLSAIAESRGKKKRIYYVILSIVYIILTAVSYFESMKEKTYSHENVATSLFIDVTSSIALAAIIVNSWKLRKFRK